ncbi:MAG: hypothetical protein WCP34_00200 [Pseudomonadota bacterium]
MKFFRLTFLWLLICQTLWADDKLVVVVSPSSGIEEINREDVVNIFLGRYLQLPSGILAQPVDQPEDETTRARFYKLLVGKDLPEIRAHWARLIFSGKTHPPRQVQSIREMIEMISTRRGAIGYLKRDQVDVRVKVVLGLE